MPLIGLKKNRCTELSKKSLLPRHFLFFHQAGWQKQKEPPAWSEQQHLLSASGFQMTNETEGPEITKNCKSCKQKGILEHYWSGTTMHTREVGLWVSVCWDIQTYACCVTWSALAELVLLRGRSFLKSSNLCAKASSSRIPLALLAKVCHNPSLVSFMLLKDV